ncbi:hypothetical protein NDU88_004927 [Pleurodeles waltl]|uniref:Uncharacterized protein n=1 Tax=Pleurodeles waltl TaxID=8319 RepID=A0AAV7SKB3_PLEWA|nr:hypothetical protein NDU88_004927 [Pleurodeles waltl]
MEGARFVPHQTLPRSALHPALCSGTAGLRDTERGICFHIKPYNNIDTALPRPAAPDARRLRAHQGLEASLYGPAVVSCLGLHKASEVAGDAPQLPCKGRVGKRKGKDPKLSQLLKLVLAKLGDDREENTGVESDKEEAVGERPIRSHGPLFRFPPNQTQGA